MVQFITLTLVSLLSVLLLMTKLHHNIVKVLWIHRNTSPRRVNPVGNLTMLLSGVNFLFNITNVWKKGSVKTFFFSKRNYSRTWLIRTIRGMPWCPYHPDGRNKWALRKNVQDTCCIDIRTTADKEEDG